MHHGLVTDQDVTPLLAPPLRRYGPPLFWQRDDTTGDWAATQDYPPGAPPAPRAIAAASDSNTNGAGAGPPACAAAGNEAAPEAGPEAAAEAPAAAACPAEASAYAARMRACLALVAFNIPAVALVDGVHSRCFSGARAAPAACALSGRKRVSFYPSLLLASGG
jgi:hypothetical protein